MGVLCKICNRVVNNRQPGIKCAKCLKTFHSVCLKMSDEHLKILLSNDASWFCKECRPGNANTSVVVVDDAEQNPEGTVSSRITKNDLLSLKNEILGELNNKFTMLLDSVNFCSDKITDFEANIKLINDKLKLLEECKRENEHLKIRVNDLENKIIDLEDYSRRSNIEIQGLPESRNENLVDVVLNIANNIKCEMAKTDIDAIHRVPHYDKAKKTAKNVVVKFRTRLQKEDFFTRVKEYGRNQRRETGSTQPGISFPNIDGKVFINEHLTPRNKILLSQAKNFCKNNNIKYIWVRDGKIFARKSDGSRVINIVNVDSFSKLINTP